MLRIAAVLFIAVVASAQSPVPRPIGKCSTVQVRVEEDRGFRSKYQIPHNLARVPGNFCSAYAQAGWEETMKLYLGEGAAKYRKLIERAAGVWNETVNLPEGRPLIEIAEEMPQNFLAPEEFWLNEDEAGYENLGDEQNVIYFTPATAEGKNWGLAYWKSAYNPFTGSGKMVAADIYINTFDEESNPDSTLILTKKLLDSLADPSYGAYITYIKTYDVILHELGHAVSLGHIPVNGNVMSREFGAGGVDQWTSAIALGLLEVTTPWNSKFVYRHSEMSPYMAIPNHQKNRLGDAGVFTLYGKLGAQEKTALACIYEY